MIESVQRTRFPSPPEGEGGSRGGNPSAIRVRGQRVVDTPTPHPPSLGYRLRSGTLSLKGRGEENSWLVFYFSSAA